MVYQYSWKVPAFNYIRLSSTQALASVTCHSVTQFLGVFPSEKKRKKERMEISLSLWLLSRAVVSAEFTSWSPRDGRVLCCRGGVQFMILNKCLPGLEISRALSRGSTDRFFCLPGVSRVCGLVERCRPSPPCLSTWMKIRIAMLRWGNV